jgi:tetratricopeptide (TPR) repeat protein
VLWYRGETASARRLVGDAIALLEREPPGAGLADAYLEMGKEVWTSGRPAEALDWLQRAMDLAESYEGVSLTARKAHILACGGQVEEAAALKARFLPRSRDIGDPQVVSNALAIAAFIEQADGDPGAALRLVEELEHATRGRHGLLPGRPPAHLGPHLLGGRRARARRALPARGRRPGRPLPELPGHRPGGPGRDPGRPARGGQPLRRRG